MSGLLSEQKNMRQTSANRAEEEKTGSGSAVMFQSRRNSSISLRKTQQQQSGSRHHSDIDSEDHSVTPTNNREGGGADFEQAQGKAQLKFRKISKKQKHKAKSLAKKKNSNKITEINSANKLISNQGGGLDSAKLKSQSSSTVTQQLLSQNPTLKPTSNGKINTKFDQNAFENVQKSSSNKDYSDMTLQLPPQHNQSQSKRVNSSVRNIQNVQKKQIAPSETFDIIRHGPSLKEKSSETSFISSPQRGSEISLNNQKSIQAFINLQQCTTDDAQSDENLQQKNNINQNKKLPLPLSPFEQFLQSLMKQNQQSENTNAKESQQQKKQQQVQYPFQLMQSQDSQQNGLKQKQQENLIRKTQLTSQYKLAMENKQDDSANNLPSKPFPPTKILSNGSDQKQLQAQLQEQFRNTSTILYSEGRNNPGVAQQQSIQQQQQLQQQISNISNFIKGKEQMMAMYQKNTNN